jgi:hypothetical protein
MSWEILKSISPLFPLPLDAGRFPVAAAPSPADGKEIFYIDPKGMLTAVPVTISADSFATGNPTPLFQIHGRAVISSTDIFTYDVAQDGQRFLLNRYIKPNHVTPLTVILHAAAEP